MPITNMEKEPSFIQASEPETAHREHKYPQQDQQQSNSKSSKRGHAQHQRLHHRKLRGRQTESIASVVAESVIPQAVTEVVQTVSIIQQIAVDGEGNTVGIVTYTTSAEASTTADDIAPSQMPSSTADEVISSYSVVVPDIVPIETGDFPTTIATDTDILPTKTDLPVAETPIELPASVSTQETFASMIPSNNATTIASSSSYTTFLSSTKSASSSSSRSITSTTSIPSTTSAISIDSLLLSPSSTNTNSFTYNAKYGTRWSSIETTSTSLALSYTSASAAFPSTTDAGGLIAGDAVGAPNTPLSASPDSATDSGSIPDDGPAPLTPPKVAGVVVGSLAAVAFLLIIAFYILKHIKQRRGEIRLSTSSQQLRLAGGTAGDATGTPMTERQSRFLPVYNAFRSKPKGLGNGQSEAGEGSEPSFVRISGRKLPSVLQHGGDGYGDPTGVPPIPQHISDASFYADDTGYHGGTGSTGTSTAVAGALTTGTAAGQRDRNLSPISHSRQKQPGTPTRTYEATNPFASPADSMSFSPKPHDSDWHLNEPVDVFASAGPAPRQKVPPQKYMREGAQRNAVVSHVAPPVKRSTSHNVQISSNLSLSPEQPNSGNTQSSGSTHYTSAQEYESLDHMVLRRPDALGRSHPSQDGSKGSRFREDV